MRHINTENGRCIRTLEEKSPLGYPNQHSSGGRKLPGSCLFKHKLHTCKYKGLNFEESILVASAASLVSSRIPNDFIGDHMTVPRFVISKWIFSQGDKECSDFLSTTTPRFSRVAVNISLSLSKLTMEKLGVA